jgi:dipeptidyl-peptidase-3
VDTVRKDGKLYLVVNDLEKAQQGVGELLGKLMRIKATGDYQGAKDLIETYGVGLNTEWRDEIRERMKALDLPKQVAFIMPELTLESLPMGRVKDVKISYPRDFVAQMLQYSGKIPKP